MYSFTFSCVDNGGGRQTFTVKAKDKSDAISKGLKKAEKRAKGDIYNWNITFDPWH